MRIIQLDQIMQLLPKIDLLHEIERGFVAYSRGQAVVGPVGELLFDDPPGDVHLKYGYITGDEYYVVKIASGFYENPKFDLPSSNGMMLLFSRKTGELASILLDEGHLTDVRTAVAGAIAAKYLAPRNVRRIGIVGTGTQARLQLEYLMKVTSCREAIVWGLSANRVEAYRDEMSHKGFSIATTTRIIDVTSTCNLIVTTTPSPGPLLRANDIQNGTHITAVGADSPHKQELDPDLFAKAALVVCDSIAQCIERGDAAHALKQNAVRRETLVELGDVISGCVTGRTTEDQITIADLTGVAVQDIQIAKSVYLAARFDGRAQPNDERELKVRKSLGCLSSSACSSCDR